MSEMSGSNDNQEQNDENTTLDPEKMNDRERKIAERRYVFQNMCKPPSLEEDTKTMATSFGVDTRTIDRDKEWCRKHRPDTWSSELAQHGFLFNTMEYEAHMKNSLRWLYTQRDSTDDPMEKLAFQKEIASTLNNIVAVGSKHPFYEGIKKLLEENKKQ